jgi:hypothetical protein
LKLIETDELQMRRILMIYGLFLAGVLNAQNFTRDAGVRLGDFFSATCRQYIEEDQALEGMFFVGRHGMTFTVLKEHFKPALGHISEYLYLQYGYGAHFGFRYADHYKVLNRTYQLEDYKFTPLLGIDGFIGIQYQFPEFPFLVSIDLKPYFEYSTIEIFSIYLQSAGISVKYKF